MHINILKITLYKNKSVCSFFFLQFKIYKIKQWLLLMVHVSVIPPYWVFFCHWWMIVQVNGFLQQFTIDAMWIICHPIPLEHDPNFSTQGKNNGFVNYKEHMLWKNMSLMNNQNNIGNGVCFCWKRCQKPKVTNKLQRRRKSSHLLNSQSFSTINALTTNQILHNNLLWKSWCSMLWRVIKF